MSDRTELAESTWEAWWNTEGSAMRRGTHQDHEDHRRHLTRVAWLNGFDVAERDREARILADKALAARQEELLQIALNERDEARRLFCEIRARYIEYPTAQQAARFEGWDCFDTKAKHDDAMDRLAKLEEEMGLT